jgi:serine protease Do
MSALRISPAALLAALTLAAVAGCGSDSSSGSGQPGASEGTPPPTTGQSGSAQQPVGGDALTKGAAARGLPSVVAVSVTENGVNQTASGTLMAPGIIVTDRKLVTSSTGTPLAAVSVRESNGAEHAGLVVGTDKVSGLAAIQVRDLTDVPVAKPGGAAVLGSGVVGLAYVGAGRVGLRPGTIVTTGRAVRANLNTEGGLFESTTAVGMQGTGGPVVDQGGKVLGIVTRAVVPTVPGASIAVPVASVQRITKALVDIGRVRRAYLGAEAVGITPTRAEELNLSTSSGVLLRGVAPGSPASFAGFRLPTGTQLIGGRAIPTGGDVIVAIDGTKITEPEDLVTALAALPPGHKAQIKVIRGDKSVTIPVTLSER